jgi:ABC-type glycerol-3-phosphate transport system substrate-binding protein
MPTRRDFIRVTGSALVLSLAGACAPGTTTTAPSSTSVPSGAAPLPTYVAFQGPKPDFPASADGIVPAGYLTFPQNLVKSTNGPVGKQGEEVNFLSYSINPTPAQVAQNPAWQQVNKDLGLDLKFTYTALQDYNVKLSTVIASGQLPDIFTMNVLGVLIPNEIDFFQTQCADLTSFVSGDAIKAFPNLANLPQTAWRNCRFNGKFYALPRVVNAVGSTLLVQQNLLDDIGVKEIDNKDDFSRVVKDTTRNNIYGMGGMQANTMQWMLQMYRAPNQWRESGGKFTKDWETPEYKDAVALLKGYWDAGYVHPDTPTFIQQQGAQSFYAGKFGMYPTNFFAFGIAWDRLLGINKSFRLSALIAPGFDGGKGVQFQDWGGNQITVLKKGTPERIKQVLGVLNYLASPFGSQEYLNLWFGAKGVDFNFDEKGNPVYTQTGQNNVQYITWQTILSPPAVLFDGLDPNFVKVAHPIETAAHELAITDPSVGLYSPTNATKGANLTMAMTDGVNQILFGRADVSTLDGLVKTWRANGGDQIKAEYEDAFAKSKS